MDTSGIVNILNCQNASVGTGFFVSFNGFILTCFHVLKDAGSSTSGLKVSYKYPSRDAKYSATVGIIVESKDIALLFSDMEKSTPYYTLKPCDSFSNLHFDTMGFPNGSFTEKLGDADFKGFISKNSIMQLKHSNSITRGFSGAPLIDGNGYAVGMIKSVSTTDKDGRGNDDALAIPANVILGEFVSQLKSTSQSQIPGSVTGRVREEEYLNRLITELQTYIDKIGVVNLSGEVTDHSAPVKNDGSRFLTGVRIPFTQRYELERAEERRVVNDIWQCIETETNKVILLGEPGSGKTVSSIRLTLDYAKLALSDPDELIPIFVPLGSYKDNVSIEEHIIAEHIHELANPDGYDFDKSRFIFIFDAFNELEASKKDSLIEYIKRLNRFVVSCRTLDYETDFIKIPNITKITILDLDLDQIFEYIEGYFNEKNADLLWKSLGGCDALYSFWEKVGQIETSGLFWATPKSIEPTVMENINTLLFENNAWEEMHRIGLLPICRCPLLLSIVCQIFEKGKKELPQNNGTLFKEFVEICLGEELQRIIKLGEISESDANKLNRRTNDMMSYLAEAIISDKQGTGIPTTKGHDFLKKHLTDDEINSCEKLAQGAKLLSLDSKEVRFFHQLLQEYFASKSLNSAFVSGRSSKDFFDQPEWWKPNGWEEPSVVLVGTLYSDGGLSVVNDYLLWLSDAQPNLTVRCVERAGVVGLDLKTLDSTTRQSLKEKLISRLVDAVEPFQSKIQIAHALGRFGDSRIGVGVEICRKQNLPKIEWIDCVSGKEVQVSKYPITVEQFFSFVSAPDGYRSSEYWTFSDEAKIWHTNNNEKRSKKWSVDYLQLHSNEPVVNVSWLDAYAFCLWLSKVTIAKIRLPTEAEWITFRESSPKRHPQGNELYPVGLMNEVSESGEISDMGLIWEWCGDVFGEKTVCQIPTRILKGGSWKYGTYYQNAPYRFRTYPSFIREDIGFRVIRENQSENT